MNTLFVLVHPEPQSFNAALVRKGAEALRAAGHPTRITDLYAEGFDPVEKAANYPDATGAAEFAALAEQRRAFTAGTLLDDVARQIADLEWADLVVFQFPIWWHSVPAMLKGWFDRVFVSGLYTSTKRYDRGHFRGKRAVCSVTSGAPAQAFVPGGRGGEIEQILWSTQFSLHYMGFQVLAPHVSFGVAGHGFSYVSDDAFQRQFAALEASWLDRLASIESDRPLHYPGWDDWNDLGQPHAATEKETCQC